MGKDIYGVPRVPYYKKPEHIIEQSQEELYWKINTGRYFRAANGSWKPILELIHMANKTYNLGINTYGWEYSDYYGMDDPDKCYELADKMNELIGHEKHKSIENFNESHTGAFIQFLYNTVGFQIA
jgi:hypothetical protein